MCSFQEGGDKPAFHPQRGTAASVRSRTARCCCCCGGCIIKFTTGDSADLSLASSGPQWVNVFRSHSTAGIFPRSAELTGVVRGKVSGTRTRTSDPPNIVLSAAVLERRNTGTGRNRLEVEGVAALILYQSCTRC